MEHIGQNLIKSATFTYNIPTYICVDCYYRIGTNKPEDNWSCKRLDYFTQESSCDSTEYMLVDWPYEDTVHSEFLHVWEELSKPSTAPKGLLEDKPPKKPKRDKKKFRKKKLRK